MQSLIGLQSMVHELIYKVQQIGLVYASFSHDCRRFWGISFGVFNKTIIPLALVGYEIVIDNSASYASLAIYHLL